MRNRPAGHRAGYWLAIVVIVAMAACAGDTPSPREAESSGSEASEASSPPGDEQTPITEPGLQGSGSPDTAAVDPCGLLNGAERRDLAGAGLAGPTTQEVGGVPQCRWGTTDETVLQIMAAPSEVWGEGVGPLMEQYANSPNVTADDVKQMERARRELEKRGSMGAEESCEMFEVMAKIGGTRGDPSLVVNYVPMNDSIAVTGQRCTGGRFTSVTLLKPDLQPSPQLARQVATALKRAHRRAVAAAG